MEKKELKIDEQQDAEIVIAWVSEDQNLIRMNSSELFEFINDPYMGCLDCSLYGMEYYCSGVPCMSRERLDGQAGVFVKERLKNRVKMGAKTSVNTITIKERMTEEHLIRSIEANGHILYVQKVNWATVHQGTATFLDDFMKRLNVYYKSEGGDKKMVDRNKYPQSYTRGIIKICKESITVEDLLVKLKNELEVICDAGIIDEVSLTCLPAFRMRDI